jgi:hypothetical protein
VLSAACVALAHCFESITEVVLRRSDAHLYAYHTLSCVLNRRLIQSYPGIAAYEAVSNVLEVSGLTFNRDNSRDSNTASDTHVDSTTAAAAAVQSGSAVSSGSSSSSSKGLGKLVEEALQCRLDKTMQRSDWQRRPLTSDQVECLPQWYYTAFGCAQ